MNESDPNGLDAHQAGAKLDHGKTRAGLVVLGFARALEEVARVGTFGANKYTDNGWQAVNGAESRYTDALFRHLLAERREDNDPDSGLLHAAHAAWNALARLHFILERKDYERDEYDIFEEHERALDEAMKEYLETKDRFMEPYRGPDFRHDVQ